MPIEPLPSRELPAFLRETAAPVQRPAMVGVDPQVEQEKLVEYAGAIQQLGRTPQVTITLIAVNCIIFVAMAVTGSGIFHISSLQALHWGADLWQLTAGGQWWRLLTSAFLHFGLIHIAFNMWALYQAGALTERLYGRWFYSLIYLYGALMSGLASIWWDKPAVSAGASGAIFAVFGALLAYLIMHRQAFPKPVLQPLMKSTLAFIAYNIFFGLTQKNISNSAHIGGLFSGLFIGLIMARPLDAVRRARQTWPRLIAGALVAVLTFGGAIHAIPKADAKKFAEVPTDDAAAAFNKGVSDLTANPPKYTDAFACFKTAAEAGVPEAMENLGCMYSRGQGTAKDPRQAVAWFRKAADAGFPMAMIALGTCYESGDGIAVDDKQAAIWFSKSASTGSVDAMKALAELYARGGVNEADDYATKCLDWFHKAADAGSSDALLAIGMLYERGDGVGPDYSQAMIWYRKAAAAGVTEGNTHVGLLYAAGLGVPKNLHRAAECYQKAAEAGDPIAMRKLAECYATGSGVQKNPEAAALWNHAAEVMTAQAPAKH